MAFIDTQNAKIYYEKLTETSEGPLSGDWVTLVNGHMRPGRDFRLLRNQLLQKGLKVITLDNRDSGQSTSEDDYDVTDMAEDIVAIWRQEEITQSHVLGISMGGLIAQTLVLNHSEMVTSLALISTFADPSWMLSEDPAWGREIGENVDVLKTYVSEDFYQKNERLIEIMAEQTTKDILQNQFLKRAKRQRMATRDFFVNPVGLEQISCPSLIVHGDQDQIVKKESSEFLAEKIPNAKLEMINNRGHLLLAEASGELFEVYCQFLESASK